MKKLCILLVIVLIIVTITTIYQVIADQPSTSVILSANPEALRVTQDFDFYPITANPEALRGKP